MIEILPDREEGIVALLVEQRLIDAAADMCPPGKKPDGIAIRIKSAEGFMEFMSELMAAGVAVWPEVKELWDSVPDPGST